MQSTHYSKMPIIDTSSGIILGYEVLLRRFKNRQLKHFNQQPELFIRYHTQLIDTLQALDKKQQIRAAGEKLFLNLLPQQLHSKQALYALKALQQKPDFLLVIEITELSLKHSTEEMQSSVAQLQREGCELAIDDFGSLESNFLRILSLSPDYIKLDKAFIHKKSWEKKQLEALKHLVAFFHKLGSKVIMEGIESQQQLQIATRVAADYVQGFYFGLPEPVA